MLGEISRQLIQRGKEREEKRERQRKRKKDRERRGNEEERKTDRKREHSKIANKNIKINTTALRD